MVFLGPEFSTRLYKAPTSFIEVSWTHSEVLKNFGPYFSSAKCFDKSLEMNSLENVQRQSPRYGL